MSEINHHNDIHKPIILAIDTSCDETSVAIVQGEKILSNVISSQIRYHKKYGGVVPFLAKRLHKERIDSVVNIALTRSELSQNNRTPDYIAVTIGPGLAPALEIGIEKAKDLAKKWNIPLIPTNHMSGHMAACFAQVGSKSHSIKYPFLAILVSGGHSEFIYCEKWGQYEILGQTLDDALGEAYDKVAKMLDLGYPGGKVVSKLAQEGDAKAYELPIPMLRSGDYNLSYSGLKNAFRLLAEDLKERNNGILNRKQVVDLCACFEKVAQESLLLKLDKILDHYTVENVLLGGGVAANTTLRKKIRSITKRYGKKLYYPLSQKLCTDNGAMIGVAAYYNLLNNCNILTLNQIDKIDRKPGMDITDILSLN